MEYITEISGVLGEMAAGNFEFDSKCSYEGGFSDIKKGLISTRNRISGTLSKIAQAAGQVDSGANQIVLGAQSQAQGATEQASSGKNLRQ